MVRTLESRRGERIAFAHRPGAGPTVMFLPGYMSEMEGGKATAVDAWAAARGQACLRFDYAGCGMSGGRFEDATLASWRDDVLDVAGVADGPLVLVGSSMGGWLMLLAALTMPERIAALVGIAAAPDFTDWGFTAAEKAGLESGETLRHPSDYADSPYLTTAGFWRGGQANLLLGAAIPIDCPVRLLHGQADADVPFDISVRLAGRLRSADVQTLLIKDGDHRLSRPRDIDLLLGTLNAVIGDRP